MNRVKLVFISLYLLITCPVFTQDLISLNFHNEPLPVILEKLRINYALKFAYDNKLLQKYKITVNLKDRIPTDAIKEILSGTDLEYEIENGIIIIKPSESKETKVYDFVIKGILKDSSTNETLPYAAVCDIKKNRCVLSNEDGIFAITNREKSEQAILEFSYLGYKKITRTFKSDTTEAIHIIYLSQKGTYFKDVIIQDGQQSIIEKEPNAGHYSINTAKLTHMPQIGEYDLLNNLELLPGISSSGKENSGISVRGSAPEHNLIVFDGINLYHSDHFFGEFSSINPAVIKNAQVYKGGFEAKYGGRATSLTIFSCKNGNRNKPSLSINMNMLSTGFLAETPVGKKFSLLIAARRAFSDFIESNVYRSIFKSIRNNKDETILNFGGIYEEISNKPKPNFFYYDVNARLSYYKSEKDIITFSFFNCYDKFSILNNHVGEVYSLNTTNVNLWGNQGGSIRWGRNWNRKLYSNFTMGLSNFSNIFESKGMYSLFNSNFYNSNIEESNRITDANFIFNNEIWLSNENKAEFGFHITKHEISYYQAFDSIKYLQLKNTGFENSVYLQFKLFVLPGLLVNPGIRTTYFDNTGKTYIEPRLSASYDITKNFVLKIALTKHNQVINKTTFMNNTEAYRDIWYLSDNRNLKTLTSNHFIGGFIYSTKMFDIDFESFYMLFNGLPQLTVEADQRFNIQDNTIFGNGFAKGFDLLVTKRYIKYYISAGYSYCISKNKFSGMNNGEIFPSDNDQRHEFKFLNMFYLRSWVFSALWTYGSGRPYTDYNSGFFISLPNGEKKYFISNTKHNSLRLPDNHRLDIACTYSFNRSLFSGNIGLSIINLYGKNNIRTLNKRIKPVYDNAGNKNYLFDKISISSLGFTPSLFVNITF